MRPLTASEAMLASAGNRFGFALLQQLAADSPGTNIFISPLSASMALGMAMNGAEGDTRLEMRDVLGYGGLTDGDINASYRSLLELLTTRDPRVRFGLANAVWHEQSFSIHDDFLELARAYFDAEVTALDFTSPSAVQTINDWVRTSTNGRIEKIVESIPDDITIYLMNAIYFKGDWTHQFDPARTSDHPFHAEGGTRTVRMMVQHTSVPATRTATYHAAELPYGAGDFSMVVVVPAPDATLAELLASLDSDRWDALIASLQPTSGEVHLPRFRLEWERQLNAPLEALGMRLAFIDGLADFSRLTPEQVRISEVVQKTFVEVNEEGTEAAAVTSVGIGPTSLPPPVLRADRPFLYAIRERSSGVVLFVGVMHAP